MRPKVFIAKKVPKEVEDYIDQYCDYDTWNGSGLIPRNELLKVIGNSDGLLTNREYINQELLDSAPRLRVVSNISVGYNNFDLGAMKSRGIIGTNTPTVLDDTVADLVLGLMIATARRIPELDRFVKAGQWRGVVGEELFGTDVHHRTIGIIGMGRIGECIAERAKFGFKMRILYCNRTRKVDVENRMGVEHCSMEQLLQESDFVVLMTPLTPKTVNIMSDREFNLMKRSAIFINASRGETVNENALIKALAEGKISGAGLDVYSKEPIEPHNPLLGMQNVVTIPHIGSATAQTRFDMAMLAAENLVRALMGKEPPNLVPELRESVK
ncbi:D-glycerate dehydrogenase [Desulfosporosinus sp. BICA1-9]|uniref:2-hydroxyacid dehydrogenase n=1 Tax=Desulfosporosinus sp. BICA1-9 TaxID=1531958 RepID=UPI00054B6855|nr:D-glycerate dehydrogenase [Desulfosporosinus sp. BICA1-9]KJS48921.1 MAG: bifunctional glyoxylate/hydroxypyruvate reductase B [Peptococcaceae bacterium BRH_c23]KJS82995.1 MAG: bifunctional glyoxylate/hydroxypyruvate reductase B [Desulfosporosinus sp. BICA1-9]HBW37574.1 D-glycerate dehydrogenase [Desulfosporosinus sp.]